MHRGCFFMFCYFYLVCYVVKRLMVIVLIGRCANSGIITYLINLNDELPTYIFVGFMLLNLRVRV
jgi:hypothetical protein